MKQDKEKHQNLTQLSLFLQEFTIQPTSTPFPLYKWNIDW